MPYKIRFSKKNVTKGFEIDVASLHCPQNKG